MLYELDWSCDYDPVSVQPESRAFQETMYQPRSQWTFLILQFISNIQIHVLHVYYQSIYLFQLILNFFFNIIILFLT